MRNVLTHEYLEVDLGRVADAIPHALHGYRRFVQAVASFLESPLSAPDGSGANPLPGPTAED
ncbi:MAG: hypothetical protein H0V52_11385 [Acidimicrobiia bacterium]|nr:hypothetical protein [Acidimicrobiia bacterium]